LSGGTVLVTGASRGIGAAVAQALQARGYAVVGLSRTGASAAGRGIACDVTDEAALKAAIAEAVAGGRLVGLVNNAGAHRACPSEGLPTAELEAVMRLDATSVFVACREAYPFLKAAGGGTIINMGSFFERLGVPGSLAYCAAKAAVGAITRVLAAEWARDGIRVLAVAPGYIETDLNRDFLAQPKVQEWLRRRVPLARPGTPEEVGRLVALMFDPGLGFLTGETITIDGGQGMNH
jgi:NAD(P)-dependent dehydrogenase (short-subunit alcohol dehydrogenase family)